MDLWLKTMESGGAAGGVAGPSTAPLAMRPRVAPLRMTDFFRRKKETAIDEVVSDKVYLAGADDLGGAGGGHLAGVGGPNNLLSPALGYGRELARCIVPEDGSGCGGAGSGAAGGGGAAAALVDAEGDF